MCMAGPDNGLHATPPALFFRAADVAVKPVTRRLLLHNDSGADLVFRLELPMHSAFIVNCGGLGTDGLGVLEKDGDISIEVECHAAASVEILARTSAGTLHVPLVVGDHPGAGAGERRSAAASDEVWPSFAEVVAAQKCSAAEEEARPPELTAAAVSEPDEIAFYASLINEGRVQRPPAAALRVHVEGEVGRASESRPAPVGSPLSSAGSPHDNIGESARTPSTCGRSQVSLTSEQAAARELMQSHTYFLVGGLVCDSRGCTLGPAEEVLGEGWKEAFGKKAPAPFAAAEVSTDGGRRASPTERNTNLKQTGRETGAARGGGGARAMSLRTAGRASTTARSTSKSNSSRGPRVRSSAPKMGPLLSEEEMQSNWDAL